MEHRLVLTIVAEERDILAEVHVLEMICDKAAVATLDAFAKFLYYCVFTVIVHKIMVILSQGGFATNARIKQQPDIVRAMGLVLFQKFGHSWLYSLQYCLDYVLYINNNEYDCFTHSSFPPSSRDPFAR